MNDFATACQQAVGWIGKALDAHDDAAQGNCECDLCNLLLLAAVNSDVVRERHLAEHPAPDLPVILSVSNNIARQGRFDQ